MDSSPALSRRGLLGLGSAALALGPMAALDPRALAQQPGSGDAPWLGLKVGIASYPYSRLPLDAAVQGVARLGVKYVSIKDAHLPLKSTAGERKAAVKKFLDAGVTP